MPAAHKDVNISIGGLPGGDKYSAALHEYIKARHATFGRMSSPHKKPPAEAGGLVRAGSPNTLRSLGGSANAPGMMVGLLRRGA